MFFVQIQWKEDLSDAEMWLHISSTARDKISFLFIFYFYGIGWEFTEG